MTQGLAEDLQGMQLVVSMAFAARRAPTTIADNEFSDTNSKPFTAAQRRLRYFHECAPFRSRIHNAKVVNVLIIHNVEMRS